MLCSFENPTRRSPQTCLASLTNAMRLPDPSALLALLEKDIRLPEGLEVLSARYQTAKPFPHLVLDGVFPAKVLDDMVEDMSEIHGEGWLNLDTEGLERKTVLRSAIDLRTSGRSAHGAPALGGLPLSP